MCQKQTSCRLLSSFYIKKLDISVLENQAKDTGTDKQYTHDTIDSVLCFAQFAFERSRTRHAYSIGKAPCHDKCRNGGSHREDDRKAVADTRLG